MKRYLVRVDEVAKMSNPSFAGQKSVMYVGKGEEFIGHFGDHAEKVGTVMRVDPVKLLEYGYLSAGQAKKSYEWRTDSDTLFWEYKKSIVEVTVPEGEKGRFWDEKDLAKNMIVVEQKEVPLR